MAIIYTYGFDDNVQDKDAWVGTNSGNRKTKQFSALSVANYMNRYGRIAVGGQMSYKLVASSPGLGEMSIIGGGDGTNFADIEFLNISTHDLSGAQVVEFLDYLTSTGILISRQNEPSVFGHYTVVAYTTTIDPNVYKLELGILGSNGVVNTDMYYDLSPLNLAGGSGSGVNTIDTSEGSFITLTPTTPTSGNVLITADLSATGTPDATTFLRGDNTWAEASEVDGVGTTNYVSKWQDPNTLTDSIIYDDGVNVGIGTTTPSEKLEVSGNVKVDKGSAPGKTAYLSDDGLYIGRLSAYGGGYPSNIIVDPSSPNHLDINSRSRINLKLNGNTVLVANDSGNVGIGTTSPAVKLEVNGWARINGGLQLQGANRPVMAIDNTSLLFGTNNTERMRITSTGNVGIGTTNPLTNLHIANSGSAAQLSLERTDTSDTLKLVIGSSYGYLQNTTGPLSLGTTGGTQQLHIATDGNVGIGTTSPQSKLDIKSSSSNSIPFQVTNSSDNDAIFSILEDGGGDGRARIFNSAGTLNVNLDSSGSSYFNGGNVGIGTTSPATKLHVSGGGGVSTPVLFTLGSNDDGTGANAAEIRLLDNGTTKWQVGKTSLNDFWVYDNTAGRSVITARDNGNLLLMQTSGNVGIGTSGPTQELHVDGNARVTGAFYDSNNSAGAVGQVLKSTSTSTEWTDPGSITQVPVPITAFAGGSLALAATVNFVYFSWLGGSGTYTLNLPSAVTYPYKVIRFVTDGGTSASNKIHIQGSLGQTVDGGTFYALDKAYNGVQVWSDGSEWIVIQAKAT